LATPSWVRSSVRASLSEAAAKTIREPDSLVEGVAAGPA